MFSVFLHVDYGFEIPDIFVVGYALDYNEYFRDLNVSVSNYIQAIFFMWGELWIAYLPIFWGFVMAMNLSKEDCIEFPLELKHHSVSVLKDGWAIWAILSYPFLQAFSLHYKSNESPLPH